MLKKTFWYGGMEQFFRTVSHKCAEFVGNPWTFVVATLLVIGWMLSGPFFDFSDTWQLVINTATTIITFLIALLIQYSQNRSTEITQLKLDELIRAHAKAHNYFIRLDEMSDEHLKDLIKKYEEEISRRQDDDVEEAGRDE